MLEFLDVLINVLAVDNHGMMEAYSLDELKRYPSVVAHGLKDIGYIEDFGIDYVFPTYKSRVDMIDRWKQIVSKISSEFTKYHINVDVSMINIFNQCTDRLNWERRRLNQSNKDKLCHTYIGKENTEFVNVYNIFCGIVDSLHYISEKVIGMSKDEQLGLAELLLDVVDIASYTCDDVPRRLVFEHSLDVFGYHTATEIVDSNDSLADILSSFKVVIKNPGYHF